jgi:hypothetical protein
VAYQSGLLGLEGSKKGPELGWGKVVLGGGPIHQAEQGAREVKDEFALRCQDGRSNGQELFSEGAAAFTLSQVEDEGGVRRPQAS